MEKPVTSLKSDCDTGASLGILQVFPEQLFYRIVAKDYFCKWKRTP